MATAALLFTLTDAAAAKNPAKASAKCRGAIAKAVTKLTTVGLKTIDKCHKLADKNGGNGAGCNTLQSGPTDYGRAEASATAVIGKVCNASDPVRANYPDSDPVKVLLPAVKERLEASAGDLQGAPSFTGDPAIVKSLAKCHGAVGKGRTQVIASIVKSSAKCQKKIDKRGTSFGEIDPSCIAGAGKAGSKASSKTSKACGSFSGLEVGSCAALPGCMIDAATATGQGIAKIMFGGPTVCGNGIVELGETCDDPDPTVCTPECTVPECGDGIVTPPEQCDDDNDIPNDACNNECQNATCGNGDIEGAEECDDGNATANDGCTSCQIDPTLCGTAGVSAIVRLEYDPQNFGIISGMKLRLDMPAVLSVPGSEPFPGAGFVTPDAGRVTNLLTLPGVLFSPTLRDENGDSVRERLQTVSAEPAGTTALPPGDFERVVFDCEPGTPVRPADFACSLAEVVGVAPNVYDDATVAAGTACFVSELTPEGGVVTTSTAPTTTVSTAPTTSTSTSTTTTTLFDCGNTTTEGPEECDDGNENPADGCTNSCTICGNDTTTAPETCDDGDLESGDGCDANCTVTACGNGILTVGETCDDGNTQSNDACPASCVIAECTPSLESTRTFAVNYGGSTNIAGIVVLVDYPEGKVNILGSGPEGINAVSDIAGDGFAAANDLDHALRVAVNSQTGGALPGGLLFNLTVNDCSGAPVPAPAEFACTVLSASNPQLQPVPGVTCTVTN